MTKLFTILGIGVLLLLPFSCAKDSSSKIDTIKGIFKIAIVSDLQHEKCSHEDFELYLVSETSKEIYSIEIKDATLKNYIDFAGEFVEISGSIDFELNTINHIDKIVILSNDVSLRKKGKGNGGGNGGGDGGTSNVSFLVILISDANTTPACTEEDMVEQIIGENNELSISNYYQTSSKGEFIITDVTTTSVTVDAVPCYIANLSFEIDPLVVDQGYDLEAYDHILYVSEQTCPYGGRAEFIGKRLHTDYCLASSIAAHELGHNLGLMHSSANGSEYGDSGCVMGVGYAELNAPHRDNLDWMQTATIRKSGTYSLSPLEIDNPTENQILKLKIRRNLYYYFSYRAAIGPFQANINYIDHLSIHSWSNEIGLPTSLEGLVAEGESYEDLLTVTNVEIVDGILSFDLSL